MSKYGFIPDPTLTVFQNACKLVRDTEWMSYHSRPSNLKFHDLTDGKTMGQAISSLLGLNLKFIVKPHYTTSHTVVNEGLDRLEIDVHRKVYFGDDEEALPFYDDGEPPPLYVPSGWRPNCSDIPQWVNDRLARFSKAILNKFKQRKVKSNLLPFQRQQLAALRQNQSIVIANTDKGLGPCAIELHRYIRDALIHLEDKETYTVLSESEAMEETNRVRKEIKDWLIEFGGKDGCLLPDDERYIQHHLDNNEDPFGYFYLLYKIHKLKDPEQTDFCPTRPVCSMCGSLTHPLGAWINRVLQPVATGQTSYFPNSAKFLQLVSELNLPPNAQLFTADARSMYTNINTEIALDIIPDFIRKPGQFTLRFSSSIEGQEEWVPNLRWKALKAALNIVFRNNIFRFGDVYFKQISGTAMGTRPAPPWATIFFAIHEEAVLDRFKDNLAFYKRYIDDIFAIWLPDSDPIRNADTWLEFKEFVDSFHGLRWDFTEPKQSNVIFMDMLLSIEGGKIVSTIYEKPLALNLYIPPSSSHPPGVTTGLVMGQVLRYFQLCSDGKEINDILNVFMDRLIARGHKHRDLVPLFDRAVCNAKAYIKKKVGDRHAIQAAKAAKAIEASRRVYFHLPYHEDDPSSREIQRIWYNCVAEPPGDVPLNLMENLNGLKTPIDRLMVCYHRTRNLGGDLSYRKIDGRDGFKVSTFLKK